jgi:dipeptidase
MEGAMKRRISSLVLALVLGLSLVLVVFAEDEGMPLDEGAFGCTNILVGKGATVDGSTIGSYCCDGAVYAKTVLMPRERFRRGTMTPIYYRPYPNNYSQYQQYLDQAVIKGYMPQVEKTYRYVSIQVYYDDQHVGGMNEFGLTIGETTISSRSGLRNSNGLLSAYTNYKESSLMTLALQRAKTAREAIQVMGSLAERYGYAGYGGTYGEHISVTDGNEAWAFEVFASTPGAQADWTPGCGEPGAVWCAHRIPDGHVGVSANRSRIGEVPLEQNDDFMFSSNIRSLAQAKGWWNGVEPFIWYAAYGPSSSRGSSLREWRVLSLAAPSLNLAAPASTGDTRYPFSVPADTLLSVQDIMAIHRDFYQGTPYDITANSKFLVPPKLTSVSPMASPFGPSDLYSLLGISAERSIATASSVFCYVSQVSTGLPDPIKGCMWFGFGPAEGTCFLPIYSGVTKLPESWSNTDLTSVNRDNTWWAFKLVDKLPLIKWQNAIVDIRAVHDAAEATFFAQQPDLESAVFDLYSRRDKAAAQELAEKLVTKYTNACMDAVSEGYWGLADYLLFRYYFGGTAQALPAIDSPPVPTNLGRWHEWLGRDWGSDNGREIHLFGGMMIGKKYYDN